MQNFYIFFQSFKAIVWTDHNDKVSAWKSLHNITKHQKTKSKSTVSTNRSLSHTSNIVINHQPSTTNKDKYNRFTLQHTKDFLDSYITLGIIAGWVLLDLKNPIPFCNSELIL